MEKIWSDDAWDDYIYWQGQGKKTLKKMAIFVFVVDKRTFVRYNQDIEQLFPWRPRICQN